MRIAIAAIALSIAIMLISDAIVVGFQSEIKDKITGFAAHIQVSKTKTNFSFENEPIPYDAQFAKKVASLPEVQHIQAFANKPGIIKAKTDNEGIILLGVDKGFDWQNFEPNIIEGQKNLVLNDSEASKEAMISKGFANKLNIKLGDTVDAYFVQNPPRYRQFFIKAIYQTGVEEIDNQFMLVDLRHVQKLNDWDSNQIGGYRIFLKKPPFKLFSFISFSEPGKSGFKPSFHQQTEDEYIDKVNDQIRLNLLTDEKHLNQEAKTVRERFPQIWDWLGLLDVNIGLILSLMTAVAAINMITALLIMILERTKMIGVMKVLGASNWRVQKIFVINSMILISLGILIGNGLGFGLLLIQKHWHVIKLAQESYYLSEVPVQFDWLRIGVINLGAFLLCTIAMFLPNLFVTRIRPVKALRFE